MPSTLGNYTIKFWTGSTLLATSATITVSAAAPSVTVSTTSAVAGGPVTTTVTNGPGGRTDWVALYATGASTYLNWKYLNGTQTAPVTGLNNATFDVTMPTTPGTYFFRFYTGSTILATSQTVTVAANTVTVEVTPATVAPGGTVTATAANGPANTTDWLALYPAGSSSYLAWKYLNGSVSAPATGLSGAAVPFTMPTTPGTYTIKFWAGSTLLATSATITVATAPSSTTLAVTPTTVGPLGVIAVSIANGPGNPTDWVALYATGASTYLNWKYLNGTGTAPVAGMTAADVTFAMPATSGTYVIKFYGGSTVLATSETITVASVTLNASTTIAAPGETVTATVANGPANKTDWIGVYQVGGTTTLSWKYLNGSLTTAPASGVSAAAVPLTMPATPGAYELRFYAGNLLLATSQPVTVQ
jgi:hypothetical protein